MRANYNSNDDNIEDYLIRREGGEEERELLVEVSKDIQSMGIETEDFGKEIEAEGEKCHGNIHDQI